MGYWPQRWGRIGEDSGKRLRRVGMDSTEEGGRSWAFCLQSSLAGGEGGGGALVCFWFIANLSIFFVHESGGEKR